MDQVSCETCKYYVEGQVDPSNLKNRTNMCRRYPPNLMYVQDSRSGGVVQFWVWPIVGKGDFCGEWSLHDKAKN